MPRSRPRPRRGDGARPAPVSPPRAVAARAAPAPPKAAAWTTHRRRRAATHPGGPRAGAGRSARQDADQPAWTSWSTAAATLPHLMCLQPQGGRAVEERRRYWASPHAPPRRAATRGPRPRRHPSAGGRHRRGPLRRQLEAELAGRRRPAPCATFKLGYGTSGGMRAPVVLDHVAARSATSCRAMRTPQIAADSAAPRLRPRRRVRPRPHPRPPALRRPRCRGHARVLTGTPLHLPFGPAHAQYTPPATTGCSR